MNIVHVVEGVMDGRLSCLYSVIYCDTPEFVGMHMNGRKNCNVAELVMSVKTIVVSMHLCWPKVVMRSSNPSVPTEQCHHQFFVHAGTSALLLLLF